MGFLQEQAFQLDRYTHIGTICGKYHFGRNCILYILSGDAYLDKGSHRLSYDNMHLFIIVEDKLTSSEVIIDEFPVIRHLKIMNIQSCKKIFVVSLLLNLFLICSLCTVGVRSGYFQRQLIRLGIMEAPCENLEDNWQAYQAVVGWNKTLSTLKLGCDICFYGNSITNQIPFADSIKGKTVAVIGYPGAGFEMLHYTAPLVQAVHPRKLFVMAGINSLGKLDDMQFCEEYNALINKLLPPPLRAKFILKACSRSIIQKVMVN